MRPLYRKALLRIVQRAAKETTTPISPEFMGRMEGMSHRTGTQGVRNFVMAYLREKGTHRDIAGVFNEAMGVVIRLEGVIDWQYGPEGTHPAWRAARELAGAEDNLSRMILHPYGSGKSAPYGENQGSVRWGYEIGISVLRDLFGIKGAPHASVP